ncbi:MAG: glycosyltransferase family 2 protein [Acidobacteria bacterium]|nr:glycosyltransferase family 2 protein [Acidobacteriota bacterium]
MAVRFLSPVAALIVNYRTYDDLGRCLSSLDRYEPSLDIVVVDYESHPGGVAELQQRWPRVRVIPSAGNDGFAAGINRAVREAAHATRLLVLNPDSVLEQPIVEPLEMLLDTHLDVGVVGPLIRETDGRIQPSARRFPGVSTALGGRSSWLTRAMPGNRLTARNLLTGTHVREPIVVDWVSGACMLLRREAFDAVHGFDERFFMYWEDADLCRRLGDAGWKTMYHPRVAVRHAAGTASRQAPTRAQFAFHRSVFRYYMKHGGWTAWLAAPLVWPALQCRLALKLLQTHSGR